MSNQPTDPTILSGYGALSVTTVSAALSTVTVSSVTGSAAYPTVGGFPSETLTITNSPASANSVFFCPFGGAATSSIGIPIGKGTLRVFNLGGTPASKPTIISDGTATVIIEW